MDWSLFVPIVGTLVVGALLHFLKEGGLRRFRRRNLLEEFALLEKLAEHPEAADRLRVRIERMLDRYVPDLEAKVALGTKIQVLIRAVVMVGAAVVLSRFLEANSWQGLLIGIGVGVLNALVDWGIGRRRERRQQAGRLRRKDVPVT